VNLLELYTYTGTCSNKICRVHFNLKWTKAINRFNIISIYMPWDDA
jgi:hypothetical protein